MQTIMSIVLRFCLFAEFLDPHDCRNASFHLSPGKDGLTHNSAEGDNLNERNANRAAP